MHQQYFSYGKDETLSFYLQCSTTNAYFSYDNIQYCATHTFYWCIQIQNVVTFFYYLKITLYTRFKVIFVIQGSGALSVEESVLLIRSSGFKSVPCQAATVKLLSMTYNPLSSSTTALQLPKHTDPKARICREKNFTVL